MARNAPRSEANRRLDYDADAATKERETSIITIGGVKFKPRKKTVEMMQEWAEAAPQPDEDADPDAPTKPEDVVEGFKNLTRQINVLICDENGNLPGTEFLDKEMDVQDAVVLLGKLQPQFTVEEELGKDSSQGANGTGT